MSFACHFAWAQVARESPKTALMPSGFTATDDGYVFFLQAVIIVCRV